MDEVTYYAQLKSGRPSSSFLESGARVRTHELFAVACWRVESDIEVSDEWSPVPLLRGHVWIYYSPRIENDWLDEYEGIVIGEMTLYHFHANCYPLTIGDQIDQDIYDLAKAIHAVTQDKENVYFDWEAVGSHIYVLDDLQLLPRYQKKKLGYLALHKGLQSAGCESHPVFVMPSKREKDAGWEFLKQFYERMDMNASYLEEFNCVVIPSYNTFGSVCDIRQHSIQGWIEVEDDY